MTLKIRFVGGADSRLKREIVVFGRWVRKRYSFPVACEVRLINRAVLIDTDGAKCHLRWWQNDRKRPFTAEIAVGRFATNLEKEGSGVAYPTVVAAMGRALKYYYQTIRGEVAREDYADRWGDRLLDAYVDGGRPPQPWRGHEVRKPVIGSHGISSGRRTSRCTGRPSAAAER